MLRSRLRRGVVSLVGVAPGPASFADNPRDYVQATLAEVPDALARKVLHDNAQRVYTIG